MHNRTFSKSYEQWLDEFQVEVILINPISCVVNWNRFSEEIASFYANKLVPQAAALAFLNHYLLPLYKKPAKK